MEVVSWAGPVPGRMTVNVNEASVIIRYTSKYTVYVMRYTRLLTALIIFVA